MPTIQIKRGLSANLTALNLTIGEPAFTTDTGKLYIGDGANKTLVNPIDKPEGLDTANYFTKVKVNEYGQIVSLNNVTDADLPSIPHTKITGLGTAATLNTGTSAGNIPVLDNGGKLDSNIIPAIAINDVFTATSESEMLALIAERGDVCIRTDESKTYILQNEPANRIENWILIQTPTDLVQSVNSKTGVVVLNSGDILMTGYSKPETGGSILANDTITKAVGKLEKNMDLYAPLASPALTGTPTAPTAVLGTNNTQLATTEFVSLSMAVIDGGTF